MVYKIGKRKRPSVTRKGPMAKKKIPRKDRFITKQDLQVALNKNIETKQSVMLVTDGTEIAHNNFITVTSELLRTSQGVQAPDANFANNRIGDSINLRGVSMRMMVELNERYSDVTFRLLVVKAARGDVPTRATLFNGASGNKMLDTLNTERYTILAQKWFKITAPNSTRENVAGFSGLYTGPDLFSRATKIVKLWIPGTKFSKSGVIVYENASTQVKFFDYHVVLYAYSNFSTAQDTWNVGRLNDYVHTMYYKDA